LAETNKSDTIRKIQVEVRPVLQKEFKMSRSTVTRILAGLGVAFVVAATPTAAMAHGSDEPYTTETIETGVNDESTNILPVIIGGGAAAAVAIAGGVFLYTRRDK
jgi:hypothetical protein